ncbi:MAG: AsmA-like C-terminal region-containing protein [Bacteroidota bacterium]
MKQKITKISIWIIGIIAFFGIVASIISYQYRDEIIEFVSQELGEQIEGTVTTEKVDLSFFSNFPNISIQLHNVVALSTDTEKPLYASCNTDTALFAKTINFAFNPFDFLQTNFNVQKISVHNAHINFIYDSQSKHNWMFLKESADSTSETFLELSKISLHNTSFRYFDIGTKLYERAHISAADISGNFTPSGFILSGMADVEHHYLIIDSDTFINTITATAHFTIEQQNDSLHFHEIQLKNSDFTISGSGTLANSDEIKLGFSTDISDIPSFSGTLPDYISSTLRSYEFTGNLKFNGVISGSTQTNRSLTLQTNFSAQNGNLQIDENTISFNGSGIISSTDITQTNKYSLYKADVNAAYKENSFSGNISVLNFENPDIKLEGKISSSFESFEDIISAEGYGMKGSASGILKWQGNISHITDFSAIFFTQTKLDFVGTISNFNLSAPDNSPYNFSDVSGTFSLNNEKITIDSIQGVLQKSPFIVSGTITSFLPALFFDSQHAHYNLKAYVESINANPFVSHYETLEDSENTSTHEGKIMCSSQRFIYDVYDLQDVQCELQFSDNLVLFKNASFKALSGNCATTTKVRYANNSIICEGNLQLENVSTKQLFSTFNNFDQDFLTQEQIDGNITSDISYNVILNKDWEPVYPQMYIVADVLIQDGSISDFEPFIEMGSKLKVEEFNTVEFNEMHNTILIKHDTLYIPKMDIITNAFQMVLSGKHSLSGNFQYFLSVDMKKTLSNRFRKNNNMEDFGEIEQTTDGDMRIPVKIIGTADKFSIDFDFKQKIEQVKEGFQRQKDDWREILNKNTSDIKEEDPVEEPIQTDFEIQFD